MGTLVPTSVAAVALGVTPDAIRMMRNRGKLTRHGSKQRALVDLDELAELAAQRCTPTEAWRPAKPGETPGQMLPEM